MRALSSLIPVLLLTVIGCRNAAPSTSIQAHKAEAHLELTPAFQLALDSMGLAGSILIFNPEKRTYYSNDFQWARKGHLPASTFKIANSIVALETGIIAHENVILPWDRTTRNVANWNQDLTFADAFAYSCVPCYQRIARDIGSDQMRQQLDRLEYPGITFQPEEIDIFWLAGESRISQFKQINFLQRLHGGELPISINTSQTLRKIMLIDSTDSYVLRGKTGWSQADDQDNGWFVGFVEKPLKRGTEIDNQILYFATNIEPKEGTPVSAFISGRRVATEAAITLLEWK